MSENLIKNVEHSKIFKLNDLVEYEKGQISSLTLAQQPTVGVTILALSAGENVSTHSAPGDALIHLLEGEGEFTIEDKKYVLKAGESLVMTANAPHSVKAITDFKFLLTLVK